MFSDKQIKYNSESSHEMKMFCILYKTRVKHVKHDENRSR